MTSADFTTRDQADGIAIQKLIAVLCAAGRWEIVDVIPLEHEEQVIRIRTWPALPPESPPS